jgi:hypothetical protein
MEASIPLSGLTEVAQSMALNKNPVIVYDKGSRTVSLVRTK